MTENWRVENRNVLSEESAWLSDKNHSKDRSNAFTDT